MKQKKDIANLIDRPTENTHVTPRDCEHMRKRAQRSRWSVEQRTKVQAYDRKRKQLFRAENMLNLSNISSTSSMVSCGSSSSLSSGSSQNSKVVRIEDQAFKSCAEKLLTVGLESPSKKEFLCNYLSVKGVKVESNVKKEPNKTDTEKKRFSVLQLKAFRLQNRKTDHAAMVAEIKKYYGNLHKAAEALGQHYCTFYWLCQSLDKKPVTKCKQTVKKEETQNNLKQFFELKSTTTTFPQARMANKLFMNSTYEESYADYIKWSESKGKPACSDKTFHRLKPRNVYKLSTVPDNMCACKLCQHFRMGRKVIEEYGIKGVAKKSADIILQSMCSVTDADTLDRVFRDYGKYPCISRDCKICGSRRSGNKIIRGDFYEKKLLKANPGIYTDKSIIKWQHWETKVRLSKEGNAINKLDKVDKSGTRKEFLELFLQDVHAMSLHAFNWKWHDIQFEYIKNNLKAGMLLSVLDFAQNYMNIYMDEPKDCHWDHTVTVIHPIVNYKICPKDGGLIIEEHIIVSDDTDHDKFAVKAFEKASVSNLDFEPTCIIQFSDNCASQYKLKGPFQHISTSKIPTMRNYFGANHGKGPSDAATG